MDITEFVEQCSDIQQDRNSALSSNSSFKVYLDRISGYPQVKIVAPLPSDYESMDRLLEGPFPLNTVPGGQDYFAIHDNYSHYPSYDDVTYTIPLTHSNFAVLKYLFSSKPGFESIDSCYRDLVANLPKNFIDAKSTSRSYGLYQMIGNYASWTSEVHLYTQTEQFNGTQIEQLRALQAYVLSDPVSSVFVKDDHEPILNDLLLSELDISVIPDYLFRFKNEIGYQEQLRSQEAALQRLASQDSIVLCGIFVEQHSDLFSYYSRSYALTA